MEILRPRPGTGNNRHHIPWRSFGFFGDDNDAIKGVSVRHQDNPNTLLLFDRQKHDARAADCFVIRVWRHHEDVERQRFV